MIVAPEPRALPRVGPAVVVMGVFDGVHTGHQHLLRATSHAARRRRAASVAIVFDPHPDEVVKPGTTIARLTPLSDTCELITTAGIDRAYPLRFNEALRDLDPEDFLESLAPALELRGLVMTPETAFGRRRAGTVERARELGAESGFEVVAVEGLLDAGTPVSSSRIRAAIVAGDLGEAARLLGRPHRVVGTVVRGDGRGRALGFPTANLAFDYRPCLPPHGIYLARATNRGGEPVQQPALVSIGVQPTFHAGGPAVVEAYLLDWSGDLYGATLTLELLEHLRDQERFETADALVAQMREDEAQARLAFGLRTVGGGAFLSARGRPRRGGRRGPLLDFPGLRKECGGIRAARQGREERDH